MNFLQKWLPAQNSAEVQLKIEAPPAQDVVKKPAPPPPPVVRAVLTKPFKILTIDHEVIMEGITYHVHVKDFIWLNSGSATFARVVISGRGFREVQSPSRLMLTHGGQAHNCTDEMIGAFADAGLAVKRRLVDACLFPIQNQILEIERKLKNFG